MLAKHHILTSSDILTNFNLQTDFSLLKVPRVIPEGNIETATEADLEGIIKLANRLNSFRAKNAPEVFLPSKEVEQVEITSLNNTFQDPNSRILIKKINGEIAAFATVKTYEQSGSYCFKKEKRCDLTGIYVDEKYQRQGIGTELIVAARNYGKSNECTFLGLSVYHFDGNNLDFFKKLGFKPEMTLMALKVSQKSEETTSNSESIDNPVIRIKREEDLKNEMEGIVKLRVYLSSVSAEYEPIHHKEANDREAVINSIKKGTHDPSTLYIIKINDEVAASAQMTVYHYDTSVTHLLKDKTTCFITDVAVDKKYQRQGLATKIIKAVFDDASHTEHGIVELSVLEKNKKARACYDRIGFKPLYTYLGMEI